MNTSKISIGWDVGGWHGNSNGVVVVNDELEVLDYRIIPRKENTPASYRNIIRNYIESFKPEKIILCIDSPLSFPPAFIDFILHHKTPNISPEKSMIENPLAYRKAEMNVYEDIKKKPLSPSFDYLTSNSTLAMSTIDLLRENDSEFKCYPFDEYNRSDKKIIIEVYPSAVNTVFSINDNYTSFLSGLEFKKIPKHKIPHLRDAAICAWYGCHFSNNLDKLPPFTEEDKKEGKIFYR